MFAGLKARNLEGGWTCLRNSPAGASLENGCREALLGKHLEHLERSPTIITTIFYPFGGSDGWVCCWQQGGGITWVLCSVKRMDPETRQEVENLERQLVRYGNVQVRWKRPHEWLDQKGFPIIEDGVCTRH